MITTRKKAWEKLAAIWLDPRGHPEYYLTRGLCETVHQLQKHHQINSTLHDALRRELRWAVRDRLYIDGFAFLEYLDFPLCCTFISDQQDAQYARGMFCLLMSQITEEELDYPQFEYQYP